MKFICTILLSFLLIQSVNAQKRTIVGYVKDTVTNAVIEFAGITNLYSNSTSISNRKGIFKIEVKENELLSIASVGYNFDTLWVRSDVLVKDTIIIFLKPLAKRLADVTVTTKSSLAKYQLDSIDRRKEFFKGKSDVKMPAVSIANSGIGVGINLDRFYKREKRKRAAIEMFDEIENQSYINYRFTPVLVNKYTNLSDTELVVFMQQYRPSYTWLRQHSNEEDLLYYINDKLKEYSKKKK